LVVQKRVEEAPARSKENNQNISKVRLLLSDDVSNRIVQANMIRCRLVKNATAEGNATTKLRRRLPHYLRVMRELVRGVRLVTAEQGNRSTGWEVACSSG